MRASQILAAAYALGSFTSNSVVSDPVLIPSRKSQRTPEQVAELKRLAQEKRERKAAKRRGDL